MKTRRSRTRAIKITSINKPDPVLAAELLVPLLLDFHAKKNVSRRSSDIALYEAAKAADEGTRIPAEVAHPILDGVHPIKAWRKYRKLTQQVLADKAGISKGFLSQIEGGKRTGTIAVLSALARALDVPVDLLTE